MGRAAMSPRPGPRNPCTWCLNGERQQYVPGGNVALWVCAHEHMTARPLCDQCAERARQPRGFLCRECAAAGADEDDAVSWIDLIVTRAEWMDLLATGRVRFAS